MTKTVTSMDLMSWMHDVLQRKDISKPTGQPLYQYQVNAEEYSQLKYMLRQVGRLTRPKQNKAWCAAFCLFCAEWYRREYRFGWSWDGIWESLGFELDANERGDIVYKGLTEFWQRPLSTYQGDRHSYLGSAFREGGLPFALISQQDSRIVGIFKKILRTYDDVQALGSTPSEFVANQLAQLPEAFQKETTVELVVNMTELILYLTDQYQLYEHSDPVGRLNDVLSDWRKRFPIPMDENTGTDFITNLLKSASKQRQESKGQSSRINVQQWLSNRDELTIIAKVSLNKLFDLPISQLEIISNRVDVFLQEGSRLIKELGTGYVQYDKGQVVINLRKTACQFERRNPPECLFVVFTQAGKEVHREEIPDSEVLLGRIPVVVVERDHQKRIVGTGSISHRSDQLAVLLPSQAQVELDEVEKYESSVKGDFDYVEFSGVLKVSISNEDSQDSYRISTNNHGSLSECVVQGKCLPYITKSGQPAYLGVPILRRSDYSSQQWVGGELFNGDGLATCFGMQTVKLKTDDGFTIYHKRFAILPEDFSITLESSGSVCKGFINITCKRPLSVSVNQEGVSVVIRKVEYGKRIEVTADQAPPRTILLIIRPNLEANPVEIEIPFPGKGTLAFTASGEELPRNLTLDDLLGAQVHFYPSAFGSAHYTITLRAPGALRRSITAWDYDVSGKPLEVSLYDFRHRIREFLAATGNLDDKVSLEISGDCKTRKYSVGRYLSLATQDVFGVEIIDQHRLDLTAKPVLINLSEPEASPKALNPRMSEGVKTGFFEFGKPNEAPSLIVPGENSKLNFRALFVSGTKIKSDESYIGSLSKAVAVFNPNTNADVIDKVLDQMGSNFEHSSWGFISILYKNFGYLPLATFEVWKAASKNHRFLAALAFKLEESEGVMQSLQDEFNILWDLIPLEYWMTMKQRYEQFLKLNGMPEDVIRLFTNRKCKSLETFSLIFKPEMSCYLREENVYSIEMLMILFNSTMSDGLQDLLRVNVDEVRWPDYYSDLFEGFFHQECPLFPAIAIPQDFQKSVIYAPIIAALIVAGRIGILDVFKENIMPRNFKLKQIIDFDRHWFSSVFQVVLSILLYEGNQ